MAGNNLERILSEALPKLRRLQLKAWFRLVVLVSTTVTIGWIATENGRHFGFALPVIMLILLISTALSAGILRFHQQKELLPTVAAAFGLKYHKDDESFPARLPRQLLPRAGQKYRSDDGFSGEIAGRAVWFAEISTIPRQEDKGGKRQRPGFRGLVFELSLTGDVGPLMIADTWQTEPRDGERSTLDTDLAPQRDRYTYLRANYGLWAESDERQRSRQDLLQGLVMLAPEVFNQRAFLYSAIVAEGRLTVALSYNYNLFQLGGLFTSRAKLAQGLRQSGEDLAQMMRFATGALRLGQGLADPAR